MSKESSLTTPSDRDKDNQWKPNQDAPSLTLEETKIAYDDLNNNVFVKKFPEVERRYADPPLELQKIGLISFIPAKGASPNDKGVFGFAKLRGNFGTEIEANSRAEYLIRHVDSYHQIYHTYVGRPFPITASSDYSKEVSRVDLRKEMTEDISHDVKKKREKEEKDIEEIKNREQELLTENKRREENPNDPELVLDEYITLRVKKAQLTWAYLDTEKKMKEMVTILAKTRLNIEEMEEKHPENKDKYFEKYMEARKRSGLDNARHEENFIKFMVEDVTIPDVEEKYAELKRKGENNEKESDEKEQK